MRKIIIFLSFITLVNAQNNFADFFEDKSLRMDYYRLGNNEAEEFVFNKLVEEPYWGGSKTNLIDELNLGDFMVKVFDAGSNKLIYSRGFCSLFREWQTTAEAKKYKRAYSESVVFPFPKNKVVVEVHGRDKKNNFYKLFGHEVDPEDYFIIQERKLKYDNFEVHNSGDHSVKYDIVLLPEGYTADEMGDFKEACKKFTEALWKYEPFNKNKENINVWGVYAPSIDSGVDIPRDSVWKNTLLNSKYYTFDSERYLMTDDFYAVKDLAANAPYDQIYILANSDKYGGGAIYNYYSLTAIKNNLSEEVFVHELGHGLAGLADEYVDPYTYEEFYSLDVEPWEVNITTLVDFDSKWKNLLKEGTPVPTPDEPDYDDKLGVFEGGGYVAKGVYRPTRNSIMNSLSAKEFNRPSKDIIDKVIKFYSE
ncbi:MAG: M64 family metallopeptidase [Ignavibacteria bacterium]|jgi:hypothetical protein